MVDGSYIELLLAVIGGLLTVLCTLVGWIGNRIFDKIDMIVKSTSEFELSIQGKLGDLNTRVVVLEHEGVNDRRRSSHGNPTS